MAPKIANVRKRPIRRLGSSVCVPAFVALEPEGAEVGEEAEEVDERRESFATRLSEALAALEIPAEQSAETLLAELDPAVWIAEFDEHGLGGPIRAGFEKVQEWVDRVDPTDEVLRILFDRSPGILLFSEDDRLLASSYELTDEAVRTPTQRCGTSRAWLNSRSKSCGTRSTTATRAPVRP